MIATLADYLAVRELVVDVLSEGVDATVTATVRTTVEAVKCLLGAGDEKEVSVTRLAAHLKLDKSATSRRVGDATHRGYLHNLEERKGRPARLVIGDPLPESVEVLPVGEVLQSCMQKGEVNAPSLADFGQASENMFGPEDDGEVRL